MTKPDDIPQDIWNSTELFVPAWVPSEHSDDYRAEQGRAILAERERCAAIADVETFDAHALQQATAFGLGAHAAARTIAAEIRKGEA